MAYVARIVRKNGSVTEKTVNDQSEGSKWVAANSKRDDKGNSVMKK